MRQRDPESSDEVLGPDRRRPSPADLRPPPHLKERVLAEVAQRPSPTRRAFARQAAALTTASWLAAVIVFFVAGGVRVTGRPASLVIGTAVGTALVAGVVIWVALRRGDSTLGRARQALLPLVIGSPTAILAWKLLWSSQYA